MKYKTMNKIHMSVGTNVVHILYEHLKKIKTFPKHHQYCFSLGLFVYSLLKIHSSDTIKEKYKQQILTPYCFRSPTCLLRFRTVENRRSATFSASVYLEMYRW